MALGDPFASTLAAALKGASVDTTNIDNAVSGMFGNMRKNKEQQMIRQQGQQLLEQFGVLKPKPVTLDDYKQSLVEQTGGQSQINIDSTLPAEQQLAAAQQLFQAKGLAIPQSKGKMVDDQRAADMGVAMDATGNVTIKPVAKTSLGDQLAVRSQFKTMQDQGLIDKDSDIEFDAKGNPKVKSKGGFGVALIKFSEDSAKQIVESLKQGDVSGYQNADSRTKSAVASEAQKQGIPLDPLVLGYSAEKTAMGNVKIVDQKVQNAISAQVLLDASFDPKSGEYRVAPSQHAELAIATARMLSPTGVVSDDRVHELRQVTAREGLSKALIYAGADPAEVGGSTQSVINMFAKLIKREGAAAEQMRKNYASGQFSNLSSFTNNAKTITDTAGLTGGNNDLSSMSDDELQRIVSGG